jgi:L-lactate dehydrogenase complex protein LldG
MTDPARDAILNRIRAKKGRGPADGANRVMLEGRLAAHARNIIPKRTDLDDDALVEFFKDQLGKIVTTVDEIANIADLPKSIASYLRENNLPMRIRISPVLEDEPIDWSTEALLTTDLGPVSPNDEVGVAAAVAGIAETGTLMLTSGPRTQTGLNFLPESHIVVLKRSNLVKSYEDALDKLRDPANPNAALPRAINFISGPSKTGDIALVMEMGAHGPKRLHVIIVDDRTSGA